MNYKKLKYPTAFGLLRDNTRFSFHSHNNPLGHKKDGKCFVNGTEHNLGNPQYTCFPINFTQAQKKSFSRHSNKKENKLNRRNRRREKKGLRMRESYDERRRYRPCDLGCGGQMSWCSCCEMYSNDCCVDWGTCQCS
jgi:hypothetical protein